MRLARRAHEKNHTIYSGEEQNSAPGGFPWRWLLDYYTEAQVRLGLTGMLHCARGGAAIVGQRVERPSADDAEEVG